MKENPENAGFSGFSMKLYNVLEKMSTVECDCFCW